LNQFTEYRSQCHWTVGQWTQELFSNGCQLPHAILSPPTSVDLPWDQLFNKRYVQQEAQLLLEKADCTAYVQNQASKFQSQRESDLSEVTQFLHAVTMSHCLESYNERQYDNRYRTWSFCQAI